MPSICCVLRDTGDKDSLLQGAYGVSQHLRNSELKQNRNCSNLYTKKNHSKENLYNKMILVVYNENSTDLVAVICIYNGLLAFCQLYILAPL